MFILSARKKYQISMQHWMCTQKPFFSFSIIRTVTSVCFVNKATLHLGHVTRYILCAAACMKQRQISHWTYLYSPDVFLAVRSDGNLNPYDGSSPFEPDDALEAVGVPSGHHLESLPLPYRIFYYFFALILFLGNSCLVILGKGTTLSICKGVLVSRKSFHRFYCERKKFFNLSIARFHSGVLFLFKR